MDIDLQDTGQVEENRPVRPRLLAVTAAAVIAIGGLALMPDQHEVPESSLLDQDSVLIDPASPRAVAESFMDAWVRGDFEATAALFSPEGTFLHQSPGNSQQLSLDVLQDGSWAVGWKFQNEGCALYSSAGRLFSCAYSYETELTRGLGMEPPRGSFLLFITDGGIRWVVDQPIEGQDDVWTTFLNWIWNNHPDDFDRMSGDGSVGAPAIAAFAGQLRVDQTSRALWEEYTAEFIASARAEKAEYVALVSAICAAAHTRLDEELQAAGSEGIAAYEKAARRVMGDTLRKLRASRPPEIIQARFDHLYGLMEQFAEGEETPFTPGPEFWIHQVEREPSLVACTFSLPR